MGVHFKSVHYDTGIMAYEFTYQTFDGLQEADGNAFDPVLDGMIPRGEEVIAAYKSGKGGAVFTSKRVLAIDAKGITGKQKVITVVPYDKASAYAVEGASLKSFDGKLTIWNRGIGAITFDFSDKTDLTSVVRAIGAQS